MTTDLGVECMVGLCLAAAIWWIARRRRTHTEGPKTRLDPLGLAELEPLSTTDDKTKDDLLVEDNSMQGNASGVPGKDLPLDSSPSPQPQQQEEEQRFEADDVDNEPDQEGEEDKDESWDVEDEDDAAEPDLTDDEDEEDEAGDDEEEEHEEEEDEDEDEEEEKDEPRVVSAEIEGVPLETLAKVEALAAKMGVNMTESFMAMEEFLVLDAPPSPGHVLPSFEADRMRLEDPAVVVPLSDTTSESPSEGGEETDNSNDANGDDDQPVDETKEEEEVRERRESHDDSEQLQEDAPAPDQAEAASFWAKCENKEECNLCHTPFTFLTRRHHCRKCFASVCGACSANSAPLPEFGARLERVCDTCWASLQQQDEHKSS